MMNTSSRLAVAVLCGAVLLSVVSCSDPASVGTGLGPDSLSGGDPQVKNVVPARLDTARVAPLTGFAPSALLPGSDPRAWRFLTGTVSDPLAGRIEAAGYVDFIGSTERPSSIADEDPDSLDATLHLRRSYLHGDTTSTLEVQLYDLDGDAEMDRAPADTTFATELQPIRSESYSISPTDTLVSLPLPTAWIEEHQAALQDSSSFGNSSFDGFRLTATGGNVVVGFEHGSARLRLTTITDTVEFRPEKSFTHIERGRAPSLGEDRLLLQDGVGIGLTMAWDDGRIDSLGATNLLLNRAEISVPVDTTLFTSPGSNFVRPRPTGYRILATRAEGAPSCGPLGLFALTERGEQCIFPTVPEWVPAAARVVPDRTFPVFERWFVEGPPFTSFRMEVTARTVASPNAQETARRGVPSTVPVVIRTDAADVEDLPRAVLTVTPL